MFDDDGNGEIGACEQLLLWLRGRGWFRVNSHEAEGGQTFESF